MEDIKNKKEKNWKKRIIIGLLLILFFLLFSIGFLIIKNRSTDNIEEEIDLVQEDVIEISETINDENIFKNLDEEDALSSEDLSGIASSENYKVNQIRFGGSIAIADDQNKNLSLELYDIKSEMMFSREDEKPKFILTWKTNKISISEVVYAKDDGSDPQSFKENNYGFDHSAVLSDIDLSTIYVYRIIARDRWGNEKTSEYFSMYTGEKSASIFDLIVSSIEDTFSWAIKK